MTIVIVPLVIAGILGWLGFIFMASLVSDVVGRL